MDIEPIRRAAIDALAAARTAPGQYRRFLQVPPGPESAGTELAEDLDQVGYGTAAAANILYTLDLFPDATAEDGTAEDAAAEDGTAERAAFIDTLRSGQSAASGLFSAPDHGAVHATANRTSALELFDARPAYPLTGIQQMMRGDALDRTLDGLAWVSNPWGASHLGAGAYAALHITDELPPGAADRYFDWLWREQDPQTGMWRRGCQPGQAAGSAPIFGHLAGSFHYLFNHVSADRPWRYPAAMIDTALRIRAEGLHDLGSAPGFAEIDWVYCLARSVRRCGHRAAEVDAELRAFAHEYAGMLLERVRGEAVPFADLHTLHGTLAALAELQQALPGVLATDHPLRLVLDRRPFL